MPAAAVLLLSLGRPHDGLLQACLAPPLRRVTGSLPPASHVRAGLRRRAARATSLPGALLLFVGAVLAGRALYLRGKAELASLLIRRAYDETLRVDRETPPWPWADTFPVGRLVAPGLSREWIVLEGTSPRNLAFGPTRSMNGARLGQPGNVIVAGHRTAEFRSLGRLRRGDTLRLAWPVRRGERLRDYRVAALAVVAPDDTTWLQPTDRDALTLVTCYPFGAAPTSPQRYVVRAVPR